MNNNKERLIDLMREDWSRLNWLGRAFIFVSKTLTVAAWRQCFEPVFICIICPMALVIEAGERLKP